MDKETPLIESTIIPIHRRILEIMEELGKPFTQEYIAGRVGISRKTLQSVLSGSRPIYGTELRLIADVFHIPLERLTQKDTLKCVQELSRIIDQPTHKNRVLELTEWFSSVSIGRSERCIALTWLGRAQFRFERYEMAHQSWVEGFNYALEIREKYGENDHFQALLQNLMLSFTVRKDYTNAQQMVNRIIPLLDQNAQSLGTLCYTLGLIARKNHDFELARQQMYESLQHFRNAGNLIQIGRSLHNVAYIEYLIGNLVSSQKNFDEAIKVLQKYPEDKVYALKDLSKVYLKQNKTGMAFKLIQEALELMVTIENPLLLSKTLLMQSIITKNPQPAEQVLEMPESALEQKGIACNILMNHYRQKGDAASFLRYYEKKQGFILNKDEIYDEEGL